MAIPGARDKLVAELKMQAAYQAVDQYVLSDTAIGLGTGSTAYYAVERVGQKLASGELVNVRAVPTSERTAEQARSLGIPLTSLDKELGKPLNVTIDGADTAVLNTFGLVKGGGGALLREKVVAAASEKFIVVVDGSKIADGLGQVFALPVEIIQYAHEYIRHQLETLPSLRGCEAVLRTNAADGRPYPTDNGNFIVDLHFRAPIADPDAAAKEISGVVGVVEHGLFLRMATAIIIATDVGIEKRVNPSREERQSGVIDASSK